MLGSAEDLSLKVPDRSQGHADDALTATKSPDWAPKLGRMHAERFFCASAIWLLRNQEERICNAKKL